MSRIRIAVIVGVLAALGAAAYLLLGRSKDKAAAKVDAGVARVDPKTPVTADRAPRLAADNAIIWRDDDPKGPLRIEGQVIDAQDHGVKGALVSIDTNPPREVTVSE